MDPTATYKEMLTACDDCDFATALSAARSLKSWLRAGGFYPSVYPCDHNHIRNVIDHVISDSRAWLQYDKNTV